MSCGIIIWFIGAESELEFILNQVADCVKQANKYLAAIA